MHVNVVSVVCVSPQGAYHRPPFEPALVANALSFTTSWPSQPRCCATVGRAWSARQSGQTRRCPGDAENVGIHCRVFCCGEHACRCALVAYLSEIPKVTHVLEHALDLLHCEGFVPCLPRCQPHPPEEVAARWLPLRLLLLLPPLPAAAAVVAVAAVIAAAVAVAAAAAWPLPLPATAAAVAVAAVAAAATQLLLMLLLLLPLLLLLLLLGP